MRLAAIDIGSNAARLLITDVVKTAEGKTCFNKLNLVRVPLRLGFDVFESTKISKEKEDMMVKTMHAYRNLIDVYEVKNYRACATSAMRDATNAKHILQRIKKETGIAIEVISGGDEAALIYENHIAENMDKLNAYLYIDVGGGSTELTFFSNNQLIFKESFNIGTIRLVKKQVEEAHWNAIKSFIKEKTKGFANVIAIGSGGNINKVFSLSKKKDGKPLTLELLKDYHKELSSFTLIERMSLYNLREDRADVIVPAISIYINVMRWANIELIYVPKIGLADGLVQSLYAELVAKNAVVVD